MLKETQMNKNSFEASKGFTLVELMVVIAIIGILAVVALGIVRGAQTRAKDATVQATASNISTALESYYAVNNVYPDSLDNLVPSILDKAPSLAAPCAVTPQDSSDPGTCGVAYDQTSAESYTLTVKYQLKDTDGAGSHVETIHGGLSN